MKKTAVATAVAVLALGSLSGAAFAGDHGSKSSHEFAQPAPSSDQQAGQKPDNTTDHNTSCTSGGGGGTSATCHSDGSSKADASKRYGNGQTAAQIANGKGAPSGTAVTGPGNSQPHKICGRDVHAYKGGDCSKRHVQPKQPPMQNEHGKVYICHATGSATNPYVLIHVSVNALPAHTGHQDGRDIVLGDKAGACPAAGHVQETTTTARARTTVPPATTTVPPLTTSVTATTTTSASTTTTTAAAAVVPASTTTPPSSTGGVQGASHTVAAPPSAAKPSSGVLGAAKALGRTATSGTLPFTGLRLWIVELIALGLIGAGVATRLIARRQNS